MIRLWADVLDANFTVIGSGPVALKSASVTRVLDGSGKIKCSAMWLDEKSRTLLQNDRRINIYVQRGYDEPRLFGSGIILGRDKSQGSSESTLDIDAQDMLHELTFTNTLLNRKYDAQPLATVVNSLAGLASWQAIVDTTDMLITARFDGSPVLGAILNVAENNGLHVRLGETLRTLEVGAFGDIANVVLMNTDSPYVTAANRMLIADITLLEESVDLVNWILPVGAGEGAAALTLEKSTRSFVKSMTGADGRLVYYICDDDSIVMYGKRQKTLLYKDISLINNSTNAQIAAANQLADAAYYDLQRRKAPLKTYSVSVKNVKLTLRPGQKIQVDYVGPINRVDGRLIAEDMVQGLFWLTRVDERVSDGSIDVTLELSTVDKQRETVVSKLATQLERATVTNLKPSTYPTAFVYPYYDYAGSGVPARFPLRFNNRVTKIIDVSLQLTTLAPSVPIEIYYVNTPDVGAAFNKSDIDRFPLVAGVSHQYGGQAAGIPNSAFGSRTESQTLELNLTDAILNSGNVFQEHVFIVSVLGESLSGLDRFDVLVPGSAAMAEDPYPWDGCGLINAIFTVLAVVQADIPE